MAFTTHSLEEQIRLVEFALKLDDIIASTVNTEGQVESGSSSTRDAHNLPPETRQAYENILFGLKARPEPQQSFENDAEPVPAPAPEAASQPAAEFAPVSAPRGFRKRSAAALREPDSLSGQSTAWIPTAAVGTPSELTTNTPHTSLAALPYTFTTNPPSQQDVDVQNPLVRPTASLTNTAPDPASQLSTSGVPGLSLQSKSAMDVDPSYQQAPPTDGAEETRVQEPDLHTLVGALDLDSTRNPFPQESEFYKSKDEIASYGRNLQHHPVLTEAIQRLQKRKAENSKQKAAKKQKKEQKRQENKRMKEQQTENEGNEKIERQKKMEKEEEEKLERQKKQMEFRRTVLNVKLKSRWDQLGPATIQQSVDGNKEYDGPNIDVNSLFEMCNDIIRPIDPLAPSQQPAVEESGPLYSSSFDENQYYSSQEYDGGSSESEVEEGEVVPVAQGRLSRYPWILSLACLEVQKLTLSLAESYSPPSPRAFLSRPPMHQPRPQPRPARPVIKEEPMSPPPLSSFPPTLAPVPPPFSPPPPSPYVLGGVDYAPWPIRPQADAISAGVAYGNGAWSTPSQPRWSGGGPGGLVFRQEEDAGNFIYKVPDTPFWRGRLGL